MSLLVCVHVSRAYRFTRLFAKRWRRYRCRSLDEACHSPLTLVVRREMSSKRKNTPTKLAADEMLITTEEEACLLENGRTDCHTADLRCDDSDSSGSELNLQIVSGDADDDSDDDTDRCDEPPTKRQHYSDAMFDTTSGEDLTPSHHKHSMIGHNNNSIMTKPYAGSNHRKSMNHVLKRLNSKKDENGEKHREGDVIGSIKAVISSTDATVQQKQQQISDMIKELQRIRESLEHADTKVGSTMFLSPTFIS